MVNSSMKKIIYLLIFTCFLIVGCSNNEPTGDDSKSKEQDGISNETAINEIASKESEQGEPSKEESDANGQEKEDEPMREDEGYKVYRPAVGEERVFLEDGIEVQKEEVIAENDKFVQLLITSGANKFLDIYRWSNDEITLLYSELNPENPRENRLKDFDPGNVHEDTSEVFISKNKQTHWEVIEEGIDIDIEGKTYSNVLVIKKVSEEVVGETTTYIKYFAPGKGMIKEFIETTGEYGYTSEINLSE